jgi:tRNA pseudouridine55 synthase
VSAVPAGVLPLLKPPGPSSHQAVQAVRRVFGRKVRAGHAGTLDPSAAGVLPVCLGPATRLVEYLQLPPKVYRFELVLGVATDTQDGTGRVVARADASGLQEADVRQALRRFVGVVRQQAPLYSARRRNGRRLYDYARQGQSAPLPQFDVRIEALDLLEWRPGPVAVAFCELRCSSGTYVRALCADVGSALGCGGHMGDLVRCSAGGFPVERCVTLEELEEAAGRGAAAALLVPPAEALAFLPAVTVSAAEAAAVAHGRPPRWPAGLPPGAGGAVRLLDPLGRLIAVARRQVRAGVPELALEKVLAAAE